jgi:O-antigen/teichoic acid export membrane protein
MITRSTNVRNSSWNLANILVYPTAFLAATPYFIDRLGEDVFGEWMLINSYVFIAVHLVGFGLPHSITAHIAEALGKKSNEKLNAYINASSRLLGRMTVLVTLFAVLLSVYAWQGADLMFDTLTWKTLAVASFFIAVKFPEILFQSIYKGYEFYNKAAIFNISNRMIALAVQIYLVYEGYSLLAIFTSNLLINLLVVGVQGVLIYRGLQNYRPVFFKALPERKELYHFGFWTWLQTIIAIVSYQMDRFLVAWFLGTATVTYFVIASTIANHLHMAFEAVVGWLLPKISRLKESMPDTRMYFISIRAFSVGFSLLLLLSLYLVNEPLFTLWLGAEKYAKMIDFFKLFMAFEAMLIMSIVPKLYLNGIKALSLITGLELMYKSAIIIGMIVFFSVGGSAESLIWGQVAALLIFMPVEYAIVNRRILKLNMLRESILTMIPSVCIIVMLLTGSWGMKALCLVLAMFFYWLIFIRDKNFKMKILTE